MITLMELYLKLLSQVDCLKSLLNEGQVRVVISTNEDSLYQFLKDRNDVLELVWEHDSRIAVFTVRGEHGLH